MTDRKPIGIKGKVRTNSDLYKAYLLAIEIKDMNTHFKMSINVDFDIGFEFTATCVNHLTVN